MVSYNCVLDVQFLDGEITEPVTLSEAKDFCKIDISTDDAILTELITAAREMVRITQTLVLCLIW